MHVPELQRLAPRVIFLQAQDSRSPAHHSLERELPSNLPLTSETSQISSHSPHTSTPHLKSKHRNQKITLRIMLSSIPLTSSFEHQSIISVYSSFQLDKFGSSSDPIITSCLKYAPQAKCSSSIDNTQRNECTILSTQWRSRDNLDFGSGGCGWRGEGRTRRVRVRTVERLIRCLNAERRGKEDIPEAKHGIQSG